METRKPDIEVLGPVAIHNQACAVLHHEAESAVLNLGRGVFEPSWKAQNLGFYLVHANSPFKRWLVQTFLK